MSSFDVVVMPIAPAGTAALPNLPPAAGGKAGETGRLEAPLYFFAEGSLAEERAAPYRPNSTRNWGRMRPIDARIRLDDRQLRAIDRDEYIQIRPILYRVGSGTVRPQSISYGDGGWYVLVKCH